MFNKKKPETKVSDLRYDVIATFVYVASMSDVNRLSNKELLERLIDVSAEMLNKETK